MKLYVIGTADFSSLFSRPNTCFVLEADKPYLIDFPKDSRELTKTGYDVKDLNSVILTHLHQDHVGDLGSYLFYKRFSESKKIELITSDKVYKDLKTYLKPTLKVRRPNGNRETLPIEELLTYKSIDNYSGPLHIEYMYTKHHVNTIALKISYDGKTLGYSSDTVFDLDLIDFLKDADVILHEANFEKYGDSHTSISKLEDLPQEVKDKIYLVHYPDGLETSIKKLHEGDVIGI